MNSEQLANKAWEWVRQCSVMPTEGVVTNHLVGLFIDFKKHNGHLPDYILLNAQKRLFERIEAFKQAMKDFLQSPDDVSVQQRIKTLSTLSGRI